MSPAAPVHGTTRDLTPHDLDAVRKLHLEAFPTNVWSRLGGTLLTTYLRLFIDSPYASAIGALSPERPPGDARATPVGHLVGILDTRRHREWVWRHGAGRLLLALLPAIVRHPYLLAGLFARRFKVLKQRLRPKQEPPTPGPDPSTRHPVAVLSHVAIQPAWRGNELGDGLVTEFLSRAAAAGAGRACLATLEDGGAGAWYEARGWALEARRETFDGRWILIYSRTWDKDGVA
jgi:ribosomal protein S18 acetylase RimI-like enzyme